MINDSDMAEHAMQIAEVIKPTLAGHDPGVQGAVLAELVSLWIAGHDPRLRADVLAELIRCVHDLIPHNDPWRSAGHGRH